ncbi:cytidine deaminase [bacterium]|nr:MAG: cytidine deaminase [bacterium]
MTHKQLAKRAQAAQKHSFSPYSRFRVGAALLSKSGKVYTGCNIESSSFGLTICAERTAIFKAMSEGERQFKAIAVATDENRFVSPCGACRQVIMDLAGNIDCILTDKHGAIKVLKMSDLFPYPFTSEDLLQD